MGPGFRRDASLTDHAALALSPRRRICVIWPRIETRDDDPLEPGGGDRVEVGARQYPAFFQDRRAELQAVREDRAFRLGKWNFAKFH